MTCSLYSQRYVQVVRTLSQELRMPWSNVWSFMSVNEMMMKRVVLMATTLDSSSPSILTRFSQFYFQSWFLSLGKGECGNSKFLDKRQCVSTPYRLLAICKCNSKARHLKTEKGLPYSKWTPFPHSSSLLLAFTSRYVISTAFLRCRITQVR